MVEASCKGDDACQTLTLGDEPLSLLNLCDRISYDFECLLCSTRSVPKRFMDHQQSEVSFRHMCFSITYKELSSNSCHRKVSMHMQRHSSSSSTCFVITLILNEKSDFLPYYRWMYLRLSLASVCNPDHTLDHLCRMKYIGQLRIVFVLFTLAMDRFGVCV